MKEVLVIEDNRDNLKLIAYALRRSGYEVVSAETGEAGIELALQGKPLFIIMDIDLPGIDGLETTRRIRNFDSVTPIIAMTSFAMAGDGKKFLPAAATATLKSP